MACNANASVAPRPDDVLIGACADRAASKLGAALELAHCQR
ncbi:hypothetical protein XHC_4009 [Xanthomonas hortorum pv. carotae str. M081]|nr:hypothetical protein XHC_4009 [Xanthomonas hortorum pv. carotae str. M081]